MSYSPLMGTLEAPSGTALMLELRDTAKVKSPPLVADEPIDRRSPQHRIVPLDQMNGACTHSAPTLRHAPASGLRLAAHATAFVGVSETMSAHS